MYLSKLEIFGFKSFANKTTIIFNKGITGIVGPNGCGKTNIVDAIRWCLGEQKSKTLRSDKMENVIFNGTKDKKPMGMSEVSLTIVNDDNVLPTDYTEVTITRRIFRSGESEYLLNKNVCRLKDITNLFMDTGMATNAYSVIELKMVESILNTNTDERRKMFEEAAGVNKYKLRRRLALKKLEDVKTDLTRVNDIVSEVDKKVNSLERQAKKADKHNKMQSILREKDIDLSEREFAKFTLGQKKYVDEKSVLNVRKVEIDDGIRKTENELIVYREKINGIEKELRDKLQSISEITNNLHTSQKNISVAEERLKAFENNIEQFERELEDLTDQIEEIEFSITDNSEKLIQFNIELEKNETLVDKLANTVESKKSTLINAREELKSFSNNIVETFKDVNQKETKLNNYQQQFSASRKRSESLNNKIQELTNRIAKTVGFLEDLETEKNSTQIKFDESESLYAEQLLFKENLERKLNKLRDDELEQRGYLNSLTSKIEFLQTLITNLEGISNGSKALIESEGWTEGEKALFADVGNTEDKYRFALEAALKSVLNNVLIETISDLNTAVDYLKKNELGKASFYLLDDRRNNKLSFIERLNVFQLKRKRKRLEKHPKFINWAAAFVESDGKWKPYFEKALSNTVIVENLLDAIELHSKFSEFNFAALNGDMITTNGIAEGGSLPKSDETLFGRKKLIENLKNELPQIETKLSDIQKEINTTEDNLSSIDLKVISEKGKLLQNDLTNIEKQFSQFEFERDKASEEIDNIQVEIQKLAVEQSKLSGEIEELEKEISISNAKKETLKAEETLLEDAVKFSEEEFNSAQSKLNQMLLEIERSKGKIQNSQNAISRAEQNKEITKQTIAKRKSDIEKTSEEIISVKSIIEETEIEYDIISGERQSFINEKNEIENKLNEIKNEASVYENELKKYRVEREQISDKIYNLGININEIKIRLENLVERVLEEYSVELELKEYNDFEHFNFEETTEEVHRLKTQLKNLGPINLLAYAEFEEEKERMDFLHQQRDDLVQSEKDVVQTISEINETAQDLFLETFEQIRVNFIKTFQTLFDENDEADLKLEEDKDPLEAKIQIMAKPKGKRPTSIELLSGGEKTLTATALLFAIYLVKPSPFCILDEVDAPLDDSNIARFTKLISEFSSNTQFVLVTHNKLTMEAAEIMYGVTMQEEGISKLAAVQFNDELPVN